MNWSRVLLVTLALTLARNQLVDIVALVFFEHPLVARRALFYIAASVLLVWCYAVIWVACPWRPEEVRIAVALTCAWGILEEGQCVVCRIAAGVDRPVMTEMWRGICDQLSDVPISTITLALPVVVVHWIASNVGRQQA